MNLFCIFGVKFRYILKQTPLKNMRNLSTVTQPSQHVESVAHDIQGVNAAGDPLKHPDYFGVHKLFSIVDLFNARVHYGHKIGSMDDRMKPFLFGSRLGHLILDLDITASCLRQALNFTAHIAYQGGVILFVSHGAQVAHTVEKTALECSEFAHTRFWPNGNFTNSTCLFGATTRLPDLCIFVNTLNHILSQHLAVTEAAKMNIPSVGIVDTNCNPNLVTYPVPGNDDTPSAIELYCRLFKTAILLGKEERKCRMDLS